MFDRAEIIDKNFIDFVQSNNLPSLDSQLPLSEADLELSDLISLFESQVQSRHIDLKARAFKNEGKCFYTIGSSGHEGNAVFGKIFDIDETDNFSKLTDRIDTLIGVTEKQKLSFNVGTTSFE